MAAVIKGYHFSYASHSSTEPTTWTELKNAIRSLPNFFPIPDAVDTTTIDNTTPTSIPGMAGSEAYEITVAVNKEFLDAHAAMVTDQNDDAKGYFWLKIDLTNRGESIIGKFTTTDQLPTPEGNAGDLDEISWTVYAYDDLIVRPINSSPTI